MVAQQKGWFDGLHVSNAAVAQYLHAGNREPQQEVVVSDRDDAPSLQGRPTDPVPNVCPACPTNTADPEERQAVTGRNR